MSTKLESIRSAQNLIEKLGSDQVLLGKVLGAKDYAEFLLIAHGEGFDLSGLSEQEARGLATGDASALGEISEQELGHVVGGLSSSALTSYPIWPDQQSTLTGWNSVPQW
jgi:hypothetical protein